MYQDESDSRSTPISGKPLRLSLEDGRVRFGHDVLVLDRHDRHVDPDHAARFSREVAGGGDDVFADDVALVGDDLPLAARKPLDRGDGRHAVDLAAAFARRARQRLGEVGGLDIAVLRVLDRPDDPLDVAQRPDLLDFARASGTSPRRRSSPRRRRSNGTRPSGRGCAPGGCSTPGAGRRRGPSPFRVSCRARGNICGSARPSSSG